jgi:putative molybdopterin biosynthesis protein
VNREPGAEALSLLDRELTGLGIDIGQLPSYHTQVAAAIAARLADAGIASEPAARAYDLAFIPLATEHFDLVIPGSRASAHEVQTLLKVLPSRWLLDQMASFPAYDPARCGQHVAAASVLPTGDRGPSRPDRLGTPIRS